MIDIRQMRYFLAIAEAGSISGAARVLGIAQPSLSQHLQRMEADLGVALIRRSPRGILLTEDGVAFARHARQISDSLEHSLADMRDRAGTIRGSVAFGMPPSCSMVLSVPLVETIRSEAPGLQLRLTEAMSGYVRQWIEDGTVDMGILYDIEGCDLAATHVLDEELFFFSAPDAWPLDTPPGAPVPLKSLAGLELVLPSSGLRAMIERFCRAQDITLNVVVEMDAMTQIKELVARGSGYTIFAPAAAQDYVARGELIRAPIVAPRMCRPVYLVGNPRRVMTRAGDVVHDTARRVVHDLVARGIWEGQPVGPIAVPRG